MSDDLLKTPLYDWHVAHGGRMVDFAGWSMPVQYASIIAEHQATRTAAGLFDISHMGRLRFDGDGACEFLDRLVTRRTTDLRPGRIRYALLTNDAGSILDDVLVYHLQNAVGGSYYLLVVNASNRLKILEWIEPRLAEAKDVTLSDVTTTWAMIAVQGPQVLDLAQPMIDAPLASLKNYAGCEARIGQHSGIVSRTGYTGEDGVELIVGARAVGSIWNDLFERGQALGVMAAGLGARDTLRLEAAMPLYGHELSEEIDPFEADLAFAVDLEGREFPGVRALRERARRGAARIRIGLELEGKRAPREGYPILNAGRAIGTTTSGTFSPTLNKPIAMGYIPREHAAPGTQLFVDIRGREEAARVVSLPFYRRQAKGSRA